MADSKEKLVSLTFSFALLALTAFGYAAILFS
jgi:hypothetical protein